MGKCTGCGSCAEVCPLEAIKIKNNKAKINKNECAGSDVCIDKCQTEALSID